MRKKILERRKARLRLSSVGSIDANWTGAIRKAERNPDPKTEP